MNTAKKNPTALEIVTEHWGADAPVWVMKLAAACDTSSQAAAARKISRSASLVNQVLKNRYTGSLDDVQSRVESAFSITGTNCPVLGMIDGSVCLKHQKTEYNPSNFMAVRLYAACRRCPHNISNKRSD